MAANRRIALFLQRRDNDYQQLLHDDCLATASEHAFSVEVFYAEGDANRQVQQLREALREPTATRPTAVLVSPVREGTLMPTVDEAVRARVGWIVLSQWSEYLSAQRGQFGTLPVFCVMPDAEEIGRVQALQFKALLPNGGELVYIRGPLGAFSAERRLAGMRKELPGSSLNPVIFTGNWSSESGERAMGNWLRAFGGSELPLYVVGAQNDRMAMGAREALLKAAAQNKRSARRFAVTGCDGSPSYGQRLVGEGKLTATVVIPSVSGRAVVELASVIDGGPPPPLAITVGVSSYPDIEVLAKREPK
ncbi:MAG TPA: sugar ABC transporter substrate-binding protein [Polyangiaceae bacterium]|nr:sugar ABC transporter substrate-binding protein [Polyangiaceae bacterium]